jgi:hypothetical protein
MNEWENNFSSLDILNSIVSSYHKILDDDKMLYVFNACLSCDFGEFKKGTTLHWICLDLKKKKGIFMKDKDTTIKYKLTLRLAVDELITPVRVRTRSGLDFFIFSFVCFFLFFFLDVDHDYRKVDEEINVESNMETKEESNTESKAEAKTESKEETKEESKPVGAEVETKDEPKKEKRKRNSTPLISPETKVY